MTTTTTTRSVRDVVGALRGIADLMWSLHTSDDLAAPVEVRVTLRAGYVPGDGTAKQTMVDQVAAIFGVTAAFSDVTAGYGMYRATVHGEGQPWKLIASAYVERPDPNAALHAELEQLRAKVAAFEAVNAEQVTYTLGSSYSGAVLDAIAETLADQDDELETYAQAEADQDRCPTAEGFAAWQARRADAHQALQDGQR